MTNKEAVVILDELGGSCSSDDEYVACHMAIAALEKQDGKKPVLIDGSTWSKCPVCGSTDIDEYCSKCGQRIDWRD